MKEITLGRTGIRTNKNAFGALPIQRVAMEYAEKLLKRAFEAGINFFDSARGYSDSEEKIGNALSSVRKSVILATKTPSKNAEGFWKDLAASLEKLQTDYIDVFQFHNPGSCPRPGDGSGLYEAMLEAREQGKIRFIGITNHRISIAEEAVRSGLYDTLQFPFSYLSSDEDIGLVRLCEERDVGFIAMKALSGGLITNAAAAYAWLDQFDRVLPIWGIQREEELDDFIAFTKEPPALNDALRQVIEADRKELAGEFCRGCGYCMPCPAGIQINLSARMAQLIRRSPSARWLDEGGQAMMKRIEDCVECGQCREKCPYGLDTPKLLKQHLEDYRNILSGNETI